MEGNPPINQTAVKRYRILWRVFLIFNFGLGAYMFAQGGKKERAKQKAVEEPPPTPTAVTAPVQEKPIIAPPIERPVPVRPPIPEDQQRKIFKWILEEKRKVKPQNRQEKKRIDEEKAILKEFIRSESIPKI